MAKQVIFDSNVWIAFLHKSDTQHKKALDFFANQKEPIAIPEYVIIEVASVLLQKAGKKTSDEFLGVVMNNEDIEVLYAQDQFFNEVVDIFRKSSMKTLSFIDFVLLYLARSYQVITFDKNLQKAIRVQGK